MIPEVLREAIEQELNRYPFAKIKAARETLTEKYREGLNHRLTSDEERAAYIATRMPATLAALTKVLETLDLKGKTLLDLGAGPGTACWAASDCSHITHIEHDSSMIALAKRLQPNSPHTWLMGNFKTMTFPPVDVVLFSYSFNEAVDVALIQKAWEVANLLVILEPGTPRGYQHILQARDKLISLGAQLIAPCPHNKACPLTSPDWCHFAVRVPRCKWHKDLKEGNLGYEDEKYSYLIASKNPSPPFYGRILTPPERHSGHLKLRLCTPNGIQEPILSKSDGALYKQAKKLEWGEEINAFA